MFDIIDINKNETISISELKQHLLLGDKYKLSALKLNMKEVEGL